MLSQKMPTWANCNDRGAICSSTSQVSRTPAISKSELVMSPFGLEVETRRLVMSAGHSRLHTVCGMSDEPCIQTPPTPKPDASTYDM